MAYISVNDAVERTGKGQTTIYRFCRKFEHTRHIKREDKKFLIDEEFLSKHLTTEDGEQTEEVKSEKPKKELIDVFIEELMNEKSYYRQLLDRKDEQLIRKDGIISSLQERQKELHYLLNHQTQLLESARRPEEEMAAKPEEESIGKGPEFEAPEPVQMKNTNAAVLKSGDMATEARVVYSVLAAVGFILFLAVVFVDEIRALVE